MIACNCALLLGLLARHDRVSSNVVASLPEILVCVIPLQLVIYCCVQICMFLFIISLYFLFIFLFTNSVVSVSISDREEGILCVLLYSIKICHVYSQLNSCSSCSQAVYVFQSKPKLSLGVSKASNVITPTSVKVFTSISSSLKNCPLSIHVTIDLYRSTTSIYRVDSRFGTSILINFLTVARQIIRTWNMGQILFELCTV